MHQIAPTNMMPKQPKQPTNMFFKDVVWMLWPLEKAEAYHHSYSPARCPISRQKAPQGPQDMLHGIKQLTGPILL